MSEQKQPLPTPLEHNPPIHLSEAPQPSDRLLGVVSVGMALASLVVGWIMPFNHDEPFYLHTWWLYAQGYVGHRDFFTYLPGLWILLAPLAWLPWTPSTWLAFGRAIVAVLFGLSVWLIGRLVRARTWEALMLGAVCLVILLQTDFFIFRRTYFETTLVLVHLVLLDLLQRSSRVGLISGLAGLSIGTACMSSQRGFFYLPIQPIYLVWLYWKQWPSLRRALVGWVLGGLASTLPTLAYIAYHNTWIEEWTWHVVFPTKIDAHFMSVDNHKYVELAICSVLLLIGWIGGIKDKAIPTPTKVLLAVASVFIWGTMTTCYTNYTRSILLFLIGGMWITLVRAVLVRWVADPRWRSRIGFGLAALALVVMVGADWLTTKCPYPEWPEQAYLRKRQLQVLDWLLQVSGGEPVVAMDPYHPMLVPNATFLRGGYMFWITRRLVKSKLADFPEQVLVQRPPLIAANPWPSTDLVEWLVRHQVIRKEQAEELYQMFRKDYVQVCFPEIGKGKLPSGQMEYGDTFWIRRDRFEACPLPEGLSYIVQKPTPAEKKPRPVGGPSP